MVFFEKAERENRKDQQTLTSRKRKLEQYQRDIFKEIREDRKWYKNFRIDLSDMSEAFAALDRQQKLKNTSRLKRSRTNFLFENHSSSSKGDPEDRTSDTTEPLPIALLIPSSEAPTKAQRIWPAALQLVFEELGLEPNEIEEDSTLRDLGIDSLLQMAVFSRLGDDINRELVPTLYPDSTTVRDFRTFIEREDSTISLTQEAPDTTLPDPNSDTPSLPSSTEHPSDRILLCNTSTTATETDIIYTRWSIIVRIICDELGIAVNELVDRTEFDEIGIDSLWALSITNQIRKELPELCFRSIFFVIFRTIGELRSFIYTGTRPWSSSQVPVEGPMSF
jgi:acyl carrier protein